MQSHRESFWYAIPGVWFGAAKGFAENADCYAVVDGTKIFDAVAYFNAHKRSVRMTGTHVANQSHAYGVGGIHISYVWRKDEERAAGL